MKPLHEFSVDATKKDFEEEGYTVINFSQVKKHYLERLPTKEAGDRYHLYPFAEKKDEELEQIQEEFDRIVFRESRGDSRKRVIGWESINSFLQYHSGIHYKWFKDKSRI